MKIATFVSNINNAQNNFFWILGWILGCLTGIAPHLPELIPFLINSLSDKRVSTTFLLLLDCSFCFQMTCTCIQFRTSVGWNGFQLSHIIISHKVHMVWAYPDFSIMKQLRVLLFLEEEGGGGEESKCLWAKPRMTTLQCSKVLQWKFPKCHKHTVHIGILSTKDPVYNIR